MSKKNFNFSEHRLRDQIKDLVEKKCINNLDEIEESVQKFYGKLDDDNRELAKMIFQRLFGIYQSDMPVSTYPLFHELFKLYTGGIETSGMIEKDVQEDELAALQTALHEYSTMCVQMNADPKVALLEDLTEKGNLGQATAQMNLSKEKYLELCGELLNFLKLA